MIIVLLGRLRSGKSTAADFFISETKKQLGLDLTKKPLAAPIYEAARQYYDHFGLVWRKNRSLLEGMGEALTTDYPQGDLLLELYKKDFNPSEHIIIDDCRRRTQADFFMMNGAFFVRIECPDDVRRSRCKVGEWSEGHVTDTELDNYYSHEYLDNSGSKEDLLESVQKIVKGFII